MKIISALLIPTKPKRRRRRRVRPVVVAPVPRAFDFGFTARRPLVPLRAVTMFLNMNARQVLALIEEGKLRWAFDIRSGKAHRREVRVLRQSLFEFTGLHAPTACPVNAEREEFLKVMELILPKGTVVSPTKISGRELGLTAEESDFYLKLRLPAASFQKLIFPQEPILQGTEIAQSFSCLSQHVLNLISEQSLQAVNLRRGPKASPLITRSSVIKFLRERRMS